MTQERDYHKCILDDEEAEKLWHSRKEVYVYSHSKFYQEYISRTFLIGRHAPFQQINQLTVMLLFLLLLFIPGLDC